MLDHKSHVELSYYMLKDLGIPIPIFGSAILINSPENAEKVCEVLLSKGYVLMNTKLKQQYRGHWKNMWTNPKACNGAEIILINEQFKCIIDWTTFALTEGNIKTCGHFFTCIDDYLVIENGGTIDEGFIEFFKDELESRPNEISIYEAWNWKNDLDWKYLSQQLG